MQDLYAAHPDNRVFLHTRFGLGEDVLKPYKETIQRWLSPDYVRDQKVSVSKAKQAVSSYKKSAGETEGLAELMVFYCEQATGFCNDVGWDEESYLEALLQIFEQALELANMLPATSHEALLGRLEEVRKGFEFGVGDAMAELLAMHAPDASNELEPE